VMDGVSAGYGDRTVLSRLNLSLSPDDRIALLGSNGNGKSTFCKLLSGHLAAQGGEMRRSNKLKTAYFAQHQLDELRLEETPADHFRDLMPGETEAKVRAKAAQTGFSGSKADTPVKNLSGGEKARLMMGIAAFHGPHLLILDEPTNHLDIDSRQALAEAVNNYPGAVMLVSHDRFLIEACADRLWLVGNGTVKPFDGDLDDYRDLVLAGPGPTAAEKKKAEEAAAVASKAEERRIAAARRAAQGPLRQRIAVLDERMAKLTVLLGKVDKALANGAAYRNDPGKAAQLSRQRAEVAVALASAEEEWLAASADLE
jgi:ATP-binding cassette, subfamily F, member 3